MRYPRLHKPVCASCAVRRNLRRGSRARARERSLPTLRSAFGSVSSKYLRARALENVKFWREVWGWGAVESASCFVEHLVWSSNLCVPGVAGVRCAHSARVQNGGSRYYCVTYIGYGFQCKGNSLSPLSATANGIYQKRQAWLRLRCTRARNVRQNMYR